MRKKWIFFAGMVLLLLAAGWGYYAYQKPRAGVATLSPDYTLTAEQLYQAFVQDEATADKKYTGRVLQVKGMVKEVQKVDSAVMILLAGGDETGGINCSVVKNLEKPLPKNGATITVKGRCAGFLMDVALVDAVWKE